MKKDYICSPCRGDYENNIQRAKEYSRAAVEKGVIPVTPHIYLTQFMDDNVPEERELALKIGSELVLGCSELWAFGIDHPSAGMAAEIELAKALGIWGIGSGSDEGKIAFESKARGAKKVVQTLVSTMKEHGFIGGNVAISHCDNLALAQTLKNSILDIWENTSIEILPTRGLCSYYAERGGLIVSY